MNAKVLLAGACMLPAALAGAQSDIRPDHKHAWAENAGWTNWRDAGDPEADEGARLRCSYFAGWVWGENIGWICLGDGEPGDGHHYANVEGADAGVNLDRDTGLLSGMAWGENVGWINFDGGGLADPPRPARLDTDTYRLLGYVWGENIGWINLDDDEHYVALYCPADFNHDLEVNTLDVLAFLNAWSRREERADIDCSGHINTLDVLVFLNRWSAGC